MSYNLCSNFGPVQTFLAELWPLNLYFKIWSLQGDTFNILGPLIFAGGSGQGIAMCNTLRILVL